MAIAKNKLIEKANQDYEYLTGDEATRRLQELREKAIFDEKSAYATGVKRGEARGIEKGEARGEKKRTKKIALEMLKNKVQREIIIKCTGLSSAEVEKIAKSI